MKSQQSRQTWFDDNCKRFEAETTISTMSVAGCKHVGKIKRVNATEVQCECGAGWIDNGRWNFV